MSYILVFNPFQVNFYEKIFFQRRYSNGQQVHKKVLNITDNQEKTNLNH